MNCNNRYGFGNDVGFFCFDPSKINELKLFETTVVYAFTEHPVSFYFIGYHDCDKDITIIYDSGSRNIVYYPCCTFEFVFRVPFQILIIFFYKNTRQTT